MKNLGFFPIWDGGFCEIEKRCFSFRMFASICVKLLIKIYTVCDMNDTL